MLNKTVIDHLRQKVGAGNVYHEREDLLVYGYDATPEIAGFPDVAVFPENREGLQAALEVSRREGLAVTPRGAATGLSGGSTPFQGGMVLGLTRMNRILEIDEENLTLTAEAGVITVDLFNAAAAKGLFYPPDPGSQNVSTLGGNVAENAGGLRGLKYGVTRNYVMALSGFLYDGTEFHAGNKCVKDVAGYSLRDLLVGSEGTLGIITEVTVRLINPPQDKRTLLAYFRDIRTAGEAVSKIIAARIIPATLEIMDKTTINCVEDYAGIGLPREMGALLLIEVDGHPAVVAEEAEGVRKILEEVRADVIRQAANAEEASQLAAARRTALSAVARVSPTTILEDATVPRSRLAETFAEIERLKDEIRYPRGHLRPRRRRQPPPHGGDRRTEPGGDRQGPRLLLRSLRKGAFHGRHRLRGARDRHRQEGLPPAPVRRGGHGRHAPDQACLRPGRPPQSGKDLPR